jgi:hypothetical protein
MERMDEQTDRQTETFIPCGLGNLIGSSRLMSLYVCLSIRLSGIPKYIDFTPVARGLEELFSSALERFLEPIDDL